MKKYVLETASVVMLPSLLIIFTVFIPIFCWSKSIKLPSDISSSNIVESVFTFTVNKFDTKCGYNNGGMSINVSGGTSPYQYKINNSQFWRNNGLFGNLTSGTYRIFVKDANSVLDSIDVTLGNTFTPPILNPSINNPTVFLCDDLYQNYTLVASGGTPPYLFTYDFMNMQSSPIFNDLAKGNYNWAVKDANGCVTMINTNIRSSSCLFAYSGGGSQNTCDSNPTADLQAVYYAPNSINRCVVSANGGPFQNRAYAYGAGLHTFYIVDTITGANTKYVSSVLKYCTLELKATISSAGCSGQNGGVKLSAKNGTTPYLFSEDGFNFSSLDSFSNLKAGIYTFMVKDADSNVAYTVVEILSSCPAVSANVIPTNCGISNGSIRAIGQGGTMPYMYSINGIDFQNRSEFTSLAAGNYTLTIRDSQGFKDSVNVEIINGECLTAQTLTSNGACGGLGSIQVLASGGQAPYTYSLDSINFQSLNLFANLVSGNYTVFSKDRAGLIVKSFATIATKLIPTFNLGNDTIICKEDSIVLNPNTSYTGITSLWSTGSTADKISVSVDGLYWCKLETLEGCIWIDTLGISVIDLPKLDLGNDTSICENASLMLDATVGGGNTVQYQWNNNLVTPKISISSPGLYWCEAAISGCAFRDSIILSVKKMPAVSLGSDTSICEGAPLMLNAFNEGSSYVWQDFSALSNYTVRQGGLYYVSVDKDGCKVADSIKITVVSKPYFTLGADMGICLGESFVLAPHIDSLWKVTWQDGSHKPFYVVDREGLVTLSASNVCGTTQDEITFLPGQCQIYIPNAFTPNGDTKNDNFNVVGTELISFFKLLIYDRYGRLVFQSNDKNRGWNGYFLSTPADPGNYIYLLTYKDNTGEHQRKGNVLLIR